MRRDMDEARFWPGANPDEDVPTVDEVDLKSVWSIYQDIETRTPGKNVGVDISIIRDACSAAADRRGCLSSRNPERVYLVSNESRCRPRFRPFPECSLVVVEKSRLHSLTQIDTCQWGALRPNDWQLVARIGKRRRCGMLGSCRIVIVALGTS
jgi:hypothetical protein